MKDPDTAKHITVIKEAYPIVSQMEEMYQIFHSILMGEEPEELDEFIGRYQDTKRMAVYLSNH